MIKISNRLLTIANLVNDNCSIIDIGCDHGLLDIYLVNNRNNIKIIASDVNKNAIENVRNNIKKYNVNNIDTRLGNGLDIVSKDEIDTIIISGMGTYTIIDIFNNNIDKLDNVNDIIIQSNNNIDILRKYLVSINYYIEEEALIKDKNIIYTVIKFKKGNRKYSNKELLLGPILLERKEELFYELCDLEKKKLLNILDKVPNNEISYKKEIENRIKYYSDI